MVRINKYLADSGVTSRRKAEELILQGRVSVNNQLIIDLSFKVNPDKDEVHIDGERVRSRKNIYFLLNKPKGVVSTTNDEKKRKTVIDLIKTSEKIYPVGRLDYNTTGVLLLTNDGDFSNLLTHPKNKVPKIYEVKLNRPLEDVDKKQLLIGIYLDRKKGKFVNLKFVNPKDRKLVEAECVEGRNRFVKRMFETLGYNVKSLNRSSFANVKANIPVGNYRELKNEEVQKLIKLYSK